MKVPCRGVCESRGMNERIIKHQTYTEIPSKILPLVRLEFWHLNFDNNIILNLILFCSQADIITDLKHCLIVTKLRYNCCDAQ